MYVNNNGVLSCKAIEANIKSHRVVKSNSRVKEGARKVNSWMEKEVTGFYFYLKDKKNTSHFSLKSQNRRKYEVWVHANVVQYAKTNIIGKTML